MGNLPAYLTISTGTSSPANISACTVKPRSRSTRKQLLPLARVLCTWARTHTCVSASSGVMLRTRVHERSDL